MKKIAVITPILVLLAFLATSVAYGGAKVVVKDILTITVDKVQMRTDVPPINVQDQTLVPVRAIFTAFSADIDWFPTEKRVLIQRKSQVIQLKIGEAHAKVNDSIVPLSVAARIYRGRTMVPLRFIAETLNAVVNWDPAKQVITITTRENLVPAPSKPTPSPGETAAPPGQTVTPTPESPDQSTNDQYPSSDQAN